MSSALRSAVPLIAGSLLVVACDKAAQTDSTADTDSFCAAAPVVTWETFGHGFLLESCQPCHGSGVDERYGAPEDVVFDTEADAMVYTERILSRATGDEASMPPEGGIADDERYFLEVWLRCYPPAG